MLRAQEVFFSLLWYHRHCEDARHFTSSSLISTRGPAPAARASDRAVSPRCSLANAATSGTQYKLQPASSLSCGSYRGLPPRAEESGAGPTLRDQEPPGRARRSLSVRSFPSLLPVTAGRGLRAGSRADRRRPAGRAGGGPGRECRLSRKQHRPAAQRRRLPRWEVAWSRVLPPAGWSGAGRRRAAGGMEAVPREEKPNPLRDANLCSRLFFW